MGKALKTLIFNGHDLLEECGLFVQQKTAFSAPARDVTSQPVPGRSGNLLLDNGRYENRPQKYTCALAPWVANGNPDLFAVAKRLKEILLLEYGYFELRDDYTPGYFYRASYSSALDVEEILTQIGKAPLLFDCEPFLFSDVGQEEITVTSQPFTLVNPEAWPSNPRITVNGSGNVDIMINNSAGNTVFHMLGISTGTVIDSELQEVFLGSESQASKTTTPEFPVFMPGNNVIQWSGSVQSLQIIPRWCCL